MGRPKFPACLVTVLALVRVWLESEARSLFPIRALITRWRVEVKRGGFGAAGCTRRPLGSIKALGYARCLCDASETFLNATVAQVARTDLVSCPRNSRYFVAIKMGRRQGARREHIWIDT
jgi:hypothetical protein